MTLSDRFAKYHFENRIEEELEKYNPNNADLHYIGDSVAGLKWFNEHSSGLHTVFNTVYRPQNVDFGVIGPQYVQYERAIRRCLDADCLWCDLAVPFHEDEMFKFERSLSPAQRANYRPHVFRQEHQFSIPIFQITILHYIDDKRAVAVGFGFEGSGRARVYVSHDHDAVEYHERFFKALLSKAEPHNPDSEIRSAA